MPIYEYKCDECGAIFENFQKITDKDLDICQSCKKIGIKKLISSSGFRLKGPVGMKQILKERRLKRISRHRN